MCAHTQTHTHVHYLKIHYEVQKYLVIVIMYTANSETNTQYVQVCF